jgi:hypothetical protein
LVVMVCVVVHLVNHLNKKPFRPDVINAVCCRFVWRDQHYVL